MKYIRNPRLSPIEQRRQPIEYPLHDIGPIIKQLCDAYDADRMIYSGGFGPTATPETYRAARERVQSYLSHLKPEERAKVLSQTAVRLIGFSDGFSDG
jgi:hypothetical protein